ncbi:hypothetical protein E3N88_08058 [Mikania micrantha]|uniref:Uncharacterized protein n=1 Tax=Mikania micrantha TaxID=192012 RepID=A0A5N6PH92_9ASTR|nr:hypothetical protein E3N88_08058 [Mikania micrantha]
MCPESHQICSVSHILPANQSGNANWRFSMWISSPVMIFNCEAEPSFIFIQSINGQFQREDLRSHSNDENTKVNSSHKELDAKSKNAYKQMQHNEKFPKVFASVKLQSNLEKLPALISFQNSLPAN